MKKFILLPVFLLLVAIIPGCIKDSCDPNPIANEIPQIEAYAAANGITTTADPSGLYYEIINMGTGVQPNSSSLIFITYTSEFLNGQTFLDQLTPNTEGWLLNSLIQGLAIGIPLIREGGHIKLIVPSSLAYGCEDFVELPGNSVLFFDINLVDVQ